MEVPEQKTEPLSAEDAFLVEFLTSELISKALDLCDERANGFDAPIKSITDPPPEGDTDAENFSAKSSISNRRKQFSLSSQSMVRSNSVEIGCVLLETSNTVDDPVTPGWRRSLRRTMSEAALSLVDEGIEVEYLEHFDPFKGSFDVVAQADEVLGTSANKHPAEQMSFMRVLEEISGGVYAARKMVGEENSSVCLDAVALDEVDGTDEVIEMDEVDGMDELDGTDEVDEMDVKGGTDKVDGTDEVGESDEVDETDEVDGTDEIDGTDEVDEMHEVDGIVEVDGTDKLDGTDEVDERDEVDGGFAYKTRVDTGNEDGLSESMKLQDQLFSSFPKEDIQNNDIPVSCFLGRKNSSKLGCADADFENRGFVNSANSVDRRNFGSDNNTKLSSQSFNEVDILDSFSLNAEDSDHRTNLFGTTSVVRNDDPSDCTIVRVTDDSNERVTDDTCDRVTTDTSDRVTDDTSDRMIDDTSDKVTEDANDRVTDDTSDRVTDDTSDRMIDDTSDKVTEDANDRVTDDTSDRVTDDTSDRVTDDTSDRMIDDTSDKVTEDANDRVTDDTSVRVIDDTSVRVTDDTSDRVTDDASDRVTDDTSDKVIDDTSDRVTDDTSDRVTDDSNERVTDDTSDSASPLNLQPTENHSTHNSTASKTHLKPYKDILSDQGIIPEPSNIQFTPNSVISNTEDVTKTRRKDDLIATKTNQAERLDLNETVSDADELGNLSFLSTDTDFSSFSAAEKFVREILSRSRSSSSTSSPRKSEGAAINTDSRMYNTLTFLDNDDSDDAEGGTDRTSSDHERKSKTTQGVADGNETLDNHKHPASDVNDNRKETEEENGYSEPTAAKKRIVPNLELLKCDDLDLNFSPRGSVPDLRLGDYYNDHTPDDLDSSPDDLDNPVFDNIDDWADDPNDPPVEPIPEYTAREEYEDVRNWRPIQIAGISYRIDMRAIEPYKKVLSHGGYYGNGLNAIVVFAACYLPDRSRLDYRYIMDNLFLYVVSVLELLVVEDYMIIYFHAATSRNKVPALRWLKRCYDMIDHRLRKNLQRLLVVHPTFFLKTVVLMTKPFISSKFSSKLHYVRSLAELTHLVPTEYIHLPEEVKEDDRSLNPNTPAPQKKFVNL